MNGSQKSITGSPVKYTEVVWIDAIIRYAPGGKHVASLKEIVIVLFSSTLVPSALIILLSSLVRTSSLKIMVMIIPNIKDVGQVGSLYLRSAGFQCQGRIVLRLPNRHICIVHGW